MNKTFNILTALLVFQATCAWAAPALVRSGEHDNFSRLVIQDRSLGEWKHIRQGKRHRIIFDKFQEGFNTSRIFPRIPYDRISNVSSDLSSLTLKLGCMCEVEISTMKGGIFIIDVKDADKASLENTIFKEGVTAHLGSHSEFGYGDLNRSDGSGVDKILGIFDRSTAPLKTQKDVAVMHAEPAVERLPERIEQRPEISTKNETGPAPSGDINEFQELLANRFGIASSQGILNPVDPDDTPPQQPELDLDVLSKSLRIGPNTGFSSGLEKAEPKKRLVLSDKQCPANMRFDIAAWSDGRPFDEQLGDAQQNLFSPLGVLDHKQAIKLARLYLHFGFGAEARQLLTSDPELEKKWPEIHAIADIFEYGTGNTNGYFPLLSGCSGAITLWVALTAGDFDFTNREDEKLITAQLSALPIYIRKILVPMISERYLKSGNQDAAKRILVTLKRNKEPLDDQGKLLEGTIALVEGKPEKAKSSFSGISSNTDAAVAALIEESKQYLSTGQKIDPKALQLLESYATQYQGSEIGNDLNKIRILSLSALNKYAEAFELLNTVSSTEQTELYGKIYEKIANNPDDALFAGYAFEDVTIRRTAANDPLSYKFADRLHALGFSEQAERYLDNIPLSEQDRKARILNASISLSLNKTGAAQNYLDGLSGDDVDALKAKLPEADDSPQDVTIASTGADIDVSDENQEESVAQSADIRNVMSDIKQTDIVIPEQEEGMLKNIEGMLLESERSRSTIQKLMAEINGS